MTQAKDLPANVSPSTISGNSADISRDGTTLNTITILKTFLKNNYLICEYKNAPTF